MNDDKDNDLAYAIVVEMGLGFEFRNCRCGQLPCARLQPIVKALQQARRGVAEKIQAARADIRQRAVSRDHVIELILKLIEETPEEVNPANASSHSRK